jgi:hypothetical protein
VEYDKVRACDLIAFLALFMWALSVMDGERKK